MLSQHAAAMVANCAATVALNSFYLLPVKVSRTQAQKLSGSVVEAGAICVRKKKKKMLLLTQKRWLFMLMWKIEKMEMKKTSHKRFVLSSLSGLSPLGGKKKPQRFLHAAEKNCRRRARGRSPPLCARSRQITCDLSVLEESRVAGSAFSQGFTPISPLEVWPRQTRGTLGGSCQNIYFFSAHAVTPLGSQCSVADWEDIRVRFRWELLKMDPLLFDAVGQI